MILHPEPSSCGDATGVGGCGADQGISHKGSSALRWWRSPRDRARERKSSGSLLFSAFAARKPYGKREVGYLIEGRLGAERFSSSDTRASRNAASIADILAAIAAPSHSGRGAVLVLFKCMLVGTLNARASIAERLCPVNLCSGSNANLRRLTQSGAISCAVCSSGRPTSEKNRHATDFRSPHALPRQESRYGSETPARQPIWDFPARVECHGPIHHDVSRTVRARSKPILLRAGRTVTQRSRPRYAVLSPPSVR
jgi:hypothetical protein